MKIILSPAKSLDFENAKQIKNATTPHFIEDSEKLIGKLKKYSPKKIKTLMSVSDAIAELNYERFQNWNFPFKDDAKPAAYVFTGEAYRGLDAASLNDKEQNILNNRLRILSGLYGILRPNDLILPYRLEMGTSMKVTPKTTNLYKFWGEKLKLHLEEEMEEDEVLVNVASNEYNKSLMLKKFNRKVITCHFKEAKGNDYKAIMTFAKKARGYMTRFIVQNDIQKIDHLKAFDTDGYIFNPGLSSETEFTFTRG